MRMRRDGERLRGDNSAGPTLLFVHIGAMSTNRCFDGRIYKPMTRK